MGGEGRGGRMGDVAFRVSLSSTHTTPPQPLTRLPQINAPEFQLRPAKVAGDPCNVGAGEKKRQEGGTVIIGARGGKKKRSDDTFFTIRLTFSFFHFFFPPRGGIVGRTDGGRGGRFE